MLVWSLVALLAATLHVAKAYPTPSSPQYSPFGKHGGIAAKVRAYNHNSGLCFPTSFSIGCGMLRDDLLIQGGTVVDAVSLSAIVALACNRPCLSISQIIAGSLCVGVIAP